MGSTPGGRNWAPAGWVSLKGRDDGDGGVGVAEERVLDRAEAGPAGVTVPADHHQVGAGGPAGQYAAGMAADDLLADRDFGVLVPPSIDTTTIGLLAMILPPSLRSIQGRPDTRSACTESVAVFTGSKQALCRFGASRKEGPGTKRSPRFSGGQV